MTPTLDTLERLAFDAMLDLHPEIHLRKMDAFQAAANPWHANDGRHIGYCNLCGRDIFNPPKPRHRCPKRIRRPLLDAIIAAKQYRDARQAIGTTTAGSLRELQAVKIEAEKFEALVAALDALE